jgi:hypothetical protein
VRRGCRAVRLVDQNIDDGRPQLSTHGLDGRRQYRLGVGSFPDPKCCRTASGLGDACVIRQRIE